MSKGGWRPLAALAAFVLIWTAAALTSHVDLHHDTLETWAWGQHPALGYSKHPPLSAWLPGLWFQVFPRQNWAFYLLAYVNAGIGLYGVWSIAGRLLVGATRDAAVLLLLLTPFFTFFANKFNANTVLLSAWPWTIHFLIRSLDERDITSAILLGVFAALAMLGKYYSALLLATCLIAALLHPNARAYFRSKAPYVAIAVFILCMLPHIWWVYANDFQPVTYAMTKVTDHVWSRLQRGTWAMIAALLLHVPVVAAVALALGPQRGAAARRLGVAAADRRNTWLVVLALGPYSLTYLACVVGQVRTSLQFMIPIFFMWPIVALRLSGSNFEWLWLKRLVVTVTGISTLAVIAGPVLALFSMKAGLSTFIEPHRQAALAATRIWHAAYSQPMEIVAGRVGYVEAVSFYSPDSPSTLIDFNYRYSPWLSPEHVRRYGMLAVCPANDKSCKDEARRLAGPKARIVVRTFRNSVLGYTGAPHRIIFFMRAPAPDRYRSAPMKR